MTCPTTLPYPGKGPASPDLAEQLFQPLAIDNAGDDHRKATSNCINDLSSSVRVVNLVGFVSTTIASALSSAITNSCSSQPA